jgi:hypothetical protein
VRNLLVILPVLLLAACQPVTVQRSERGSVPVTLRVDDAAYWLEEWYRVIDLPEDQLQLALAAREEDFEKNANPRTRLRLGMLLAVGPQPVRDQARALNLLKEMDKNSASESARALAALLEQIIGEQKWAGDKIAELRAKLKDADTRVQELERQLQELTDIEQSIQQRD